MENLILLQNAKNCMLLQKDPSEWKDVQKFFLF